MTDRQGVVDSRISFSLFASPDMQVTYYLNLFFVKGGVITLVIWMLSVASMAVMVKSFVKIRRKQLFPEDVRKRVWSLFENRQYREAVKSVQDNEDFFSCLIRRTFVHAHGGRAALERGLLEATEHQVSALMRSVEWLSVIGNVAPMLGLLGTVWGMIGSFFKIVGAGSADPRLLANDIGVALVATFMGLAVAIPSLFVYAVMRNRIEEITSEAVLTVSEMIVEVDRAERRPAAASTPTSQSGSPAAATGAKL